MPKSYGVFMFQGSQTLLLHLDSLAQGNLLTFICKHLLQAPELSEEALIDQLIALNPKLTPEILRKKLHEPLQTTMAAFPWLMGRAKSGILAGKDLETTGISYVEIAKEELPSARLGSYLREQYGSHICELISDPAAMVLASANCSLGQDLQSIAQALVQDEPAKLE